MKWLKRLALSFVVTLVALAAVEGTIQCVGDPRESAIDAEADQRPAYWELARRGLLMLDDEALRFRLKPGFTTTIGAVDYRIGEHGLRGETRETAKPAGTQRVLVVGDSYAFGLGVSESETVESALAAALNSSGTGPIVDVINSGVPAYHTGQELALLERHGFRLDPDLVVLLYYPNDNIEAAFCFAPSLESLYVDELPIPHSWKVPLSRFWLYSIVAKADAARRSNRGDFDARGETNWPVTRDRLRRFAAACREHDVAFLFAPLPELANRFEFNDNASAGNTDHDRVLALARDEQWPVVDLRAGLRTRGPVIEKLFLSVVPLDNHMNASGNALIGASIAPEARRLLVAR